METRVDTGALKNIKFWPDVKFGIQKPPDGGVAGQDIKIPVDYSSAREKEKKFIAKRGEIILPEHQLPQLLKKVSERLGISPDVEVLAVDNEEIDAYYNPEARTIVATRGLFRYFLEQGLQLSEDHVAAILAHEIEHAEVYGDAYVNSYKGSLKERVLAQLSHSEEYRADAQALRRLSKAGYNPKALIEFLRTLPLEQGRYDLGHPEQIERIRFLESRLVDDEYPLSHTSKELTPLDPDLLLWFTGDSAVYKETDEILHSTPDQIDGLFRNATTQGEFWKLFSLKRHFERIALSKRVVQEAGGNLDRFMNKLLIYDILCWKTRSVFNNGELVELGESSVSIIGEVDKKTEGEERNIIYGTTNVLDENHVHDLMLSQEFISLIGASVGPDALTNTVLVTLKKREEMMDKLANEYFSALSQGTLNEREKTYYEHLKSLYDSGGPLDQDIFLTEYSAIDLKYQTELHKAKTREDLDQGRRPREMTINLYDFRDPKVREMIVNDQKLDLAMQLVEFDNQTPEAVELLAKCMARDTGMNNQECLILAGIILGGKEADEWADYLKTQDKEALAKIIYGMKNFGGGEGLLISPMRKLHKSYVGSDRGYYYIKGYADGGKYGIDSSGDEVLVMLAGRELYLRGYPPNYELGFGNSLYPKDINLTASEWKLATEGHAAHGIVFEKHIWVLHQMVRQATENGVIDPEISEMAKEIVYCPERQKLTPAEWGIIMKNSVWGVNELERILSGAIEDFPHRYTREKEMFTKEPTFKEPATRDERAQMLEVLPLAYRIFKDSPFVPDKKLFYDKGSSAEQIANILFDVQVQEFESHGMSRKEAVLKTFKSLTDKGVSFSYADFSREVVECMQQDFRSNDLKELISLYESLPKRDDVQETNLEVLKLLSEVWGYPLDEEGKEKFLPNFDQVPDQSTLNILVGKHKENAVKWVLNNFKPSVRRDGMLATLINVTDGYLRKTYLEDSKGQFFGTSNIPAVWKSPLFPYEEYLDAKSEKETLESYKSSGKLASRFDDLLSRRFPFSTLSPVYFYLVQGSGLKGIIQQEWAAKDGWAYQRMQASVLVENEDALFDKSTSFSERVNLLTQLIPLPSTVRDIYLEMLLQEKLESTTDNKEKVEINKLALPLFTEKSSLKSTFAVAAMRAELKVTPGLVKDSQDFLPTLLFYMPNPSLARNYFLTQFENSASMSPDQLRQIALMRMSPEGKKEGEENSPLANIADRIGELNREERIDYALWLLGMSSEKPKQVKNIESNLDGHLNNLPKFVMGSTDDEKEVFFRKLFLGAEGIVDLEAVAKSRLKEVQSERRGFLNTLASNLLPDTMPQAALFREIFISVIESSDPAHASRTLVKLINKFSECKMEGKELPPEEVLAIGLSEQGVVGKKVSQSLAELDWVPDSYKKTLRRAQSEGEVVPKRAILTLLEDAGLLSEDSPIRIISIDNLIGAASNKQACFLTVEARDPKTGLPQGQVKVVGKFKRPSAQKVENIDHDLKVLRKILDILLQKGYAEALPKDFSAQISNAVRKELDFSRERTFNTDIKPDLERRNAKRRYKVGVPTIYFASEDVMLESRAPGISLREYRNLREAGPEKLLASGYGALSERDINQTVVTEALAQLITTGNIHADLHPGNIFVDQNGNLTLIDLGMNEKLSKEERMNTISLITGLATGNEAYVKGSLKRFGWDLSDVKLDLRRFNFGHNTMQLLKVSQKASTPPPELLGSVILANSKLSTYTGEFSNKELFNMLIGVVNKRELPQIVSHVLQSGGRNFLRK